MAVTGIPTSSGRTPFMPLEDKAVENENFVFATGSSMNVIFPDTKTALVLSSMGGKAFNLHRLGNVEGVVIPPWFVLTSELFNQYLLDNNIFPLIEELEILCADPINREIEIEKSAKTLREAIVTGSLKSDELSQISTAYQILEKLLGRNDCRFAIRSSGAIEDSTTSSFAGLYDTVINLQGIDAVLKGIKSVWSSSFNLRTINERIRLKVSQKDCLMGVIVQELINARSSGVVSTFVLSNNYPGIQIAANYGMGESVVSGDVSVDSWVIHPTQGYTLEQFLGSKDHCVRPNAEQGGSTVPVEMAARQAFSLIPKEIDALAKQVARIKDHYECDIDVEFAFNSEGNLFILQSRPLVMIKNDKIKVVDPQETEKHSVIARGNYSVPGVASGRLVYIPSWDALASGQIKLTPDDIALAYVTTNTWSQYLANIRGLITREGTPSSHPILLSREKSIPCVIGIMNDYFEELLKLDGKTVTIDGINHAIYSGKVPTKEAHGSDLMKQFEPIKIRQWTEVEANIPHLLHNKMVVEKEGKYWRRTPTFPLVGFQVELNLRRFALVPELVGKKETSSIEARVIDGYVCNLLAPFPQYVSLFDSFTLETATAFNQAHKDCLDEFIKIAQEFSLQPDVWQKYMETYARLRAYVWLGGGFRAYAERKVDEIGVKLELPNYYLEECSQLLQSDIPEIDILMHRDVHMLAMRINEKKVESDLAKLKIADPEIYQEIEKIAGQYRFEHQIALHTPPDLDLVCKRIYQEVEHIQAGYEFSTSKVSNKARILLPDHPRLKEWLRLSIWNRLLQSDSHHLDARAKFLVRPKLLELGSILVQKGVINSSEQIFECTAEQISDHLALKRIT